jgi:hypothetical protein
MRITNLTLQHSRAFKNKNIDLNSDVNVLYSAENMTGKTTLMRAILYALGFSIPNTELIKFADFEFSIEIIKNDKKYKIKRKERLLIIDDIEYDLPIEQIEAHSFLFGTNSNEIVTNLLGVIYFDQEKGWTLLNRGIIIGVNKFRIESFFRGLNGDDSDDGYKIITKIDQLEKKIAQYRLMFNVSEYQESINCTVDQNFNSKTYEQKIDEDILAKKMKLAKVEDEIISMNKVIKDNKNFSAYITAKKLFVRNPIDNSPIPVSSETLLDFNDLQDTNIARKNMLIIERNRLKREIIENEQKLKKEELLFNIPKIDDELIRRFSEYQGLSSIQVKAVLDKLIKERKELTDILRDKTKENNPWIADAYEIISGYTEELKIPFDYKIDIFTSNLKEKSGAILHKMVFIYKLAYIKLLSQKLGYPLPIFCDSPSGREVEKSTINEMLKIIERDFSSHQIIIASIYNYDEIFPNIKIFPMNRTLFDEQTFFD